MRHSPGRTATVRRYLFALLLATAAFVVPASAAADSSDDPLAVAPAFGSLTTGPGDASMLVPATTALASPRQCGDITVYDADDVATLCSSSTQHATPITSPACPQTVSGSVRLETDLVCTDSTALIVGSKNTVIDLNGHRITCRGEAGGYLGSCQDSKQDDYGVYDDFDNLHVFSNVPGGTIDGFDDGVAIDEDADNAKVKQLVIAGPQGAPGFPRPPGVVGVLVFGGDHCHGGPVRVGGGEATGNDISGVRIGIDAFVTNCVEIGHNYTHDNHDWGTTGFRALGILLQNASDSNVHGNLALRNGDHDFVSVPDAGILIDGVLTQRQGLPLPTGNLLTENTSDSNLGAGIGTTRGAVGNDVVNNEMMFNDPPPRWADAYSDNTGANRWNENNRCVTQTTPQPPPGVCGPTESSAP
jgi:parallel beta helix pectate lyase-like protein